MTHSFTRQRRLKSESTIQLMSHHCNRQHFSFLVVHRAVVLWQSFGFLQSRQDGTRLPRWHRGKQSPVNSREADSVKQSPCQCKRCGFNPWVGKTPWRRKWQPTPVFLPGESHSQKSLESYSPWGHRPEHGCTRRVTQPSPKLVSVGI